MLNSDVIPGARSRDSVVALEPPPARRAFDSPRAPGKVKLPRWAIMDRLQAAVTLFALLALVLIWGGTEWMHAQERDQTIARTFNANANLARVFEEHAVRTLRHAGASALLVQERYRESGLKFDLPAFLQDLQIDNSPFTAVHIIDASGTIVHSSRPHLLKRQIPILEQLDGHGGETAGGQGISKRSILRDEPTAVVLTRRMDNADGSLAGLVWLEIDPRVFSDLYAQTDMGPGGVLLLADLDGKPIVRVADSAYSEANFAKIQLPRLLRERPQGNYFSSGAVDGVKRIFSYRKLSGYPLVVSVGMSVEAALATTMHRKRSYQLGAALASLFILLSAGWLLVLLYRRAGDAERLIKSAEELRLVTDNVPATISYFDKNLRCRYINKHFTQVHGKFPADVYDKSLQEVVGDAAYRQIVPHFEQALGGQPVTYQRVQLLEGGSTRHVESQLVPRISDTGRVEGCYAITRDITERERSNELRARLAAIVEGSNDAIFTRTFDGIILSWNAGAEGLYGYSAEEMIGQSIMRLVPPGQKPNLERNNDSLLQGEAGPIQTRRLTKSGQFIEVINTHSPVWDANGKVTAISVVSKDITPLKRAQAAVAESEERFRAAFEQASVGMALRGAESGEYWMRVNQKFCDMLGYTQEELLRIPVVELTVPEDRNMAIMRTRQVRDGELTDYSAEKRFLRKDGSVMHAAITRGVVKGSDGRISHTITVVQDITESRRVARDHAKLAAIVENSYDAIVSRTVDGTVLTWNNAAERLFGFTAEEMIGSSIMRLVPLDRVAEVRRNQASAKDGKIVEAYDTVRLSKQGHLIDVSINAVRVRDAAGGVDCVAVTFRDISLRKRAEAQMRLTAGVFAHSVEGIMITDRDCRILLANPAFARITGFTAEELVGQHPRALAADHTSLAYHDEMWMAAVSKGAWEGEIWERRKNGEAYCAQVSISVIPDSHGNIAQYCAIFMDITARKIAEGELVRLNADLEKRVAERTNELERVNNELEAFSYSVSHDLRAPLRAVEGFSRLLRRSAMDKLDGPSQQYVQRIEDGVERMDRLISDLLDLARLSRQGMRRASLDLSALAETEFAALRESYRDRQVRVTVHPGMRGDADPGLMRVVLQNLIGNAWKFTAKKEPAFIEFGAEARDGEITYFVRDNGAGFDMQYAGKMFAPFQRMHTREEYDGSGIGLSTVKRIVTRHGGKVWAEARPGEGATFYFTLG